MYIQKMILLIDLFKLQRTTENLASCWVAPEDREVLHHFSEFQYLMVLMGKKVSLYIPLDISCFGLCPFCIILYTLL